MLFLLLAVPMLTGVTWYAGFEADVGWEDALLDALVAYAVALLVCLYVLWVLGRTDGQTFTTVLQVAVVLGLPAGLGAAAARLIL